jgi:hypothetical protein
MKACKRASIAALLGLAVSGSAALGGCRSGRSAPDPESPTEGGTAAASGPAAAPTLEERWRERLKKLREQAYSPLSPDQKLRNVGDALLELKNVQRVSKENLAGVLAEAEKLQQDVKGLVATEAQVAFQELEGEVMANLHSDRPDPVQAESMVERFPADKYGQPDLKAKVEDLRRRIQIYQLAEFDYEERSNRIRGFNNDFTRIIGYLEGFDPDYEVTPYGAKIRALINENYQLYAQEQEAKKQRLQGVAFKNLRLDSFGWEGAPTSPFTYKDDEKVLILGPNPSDYEEKDSDGSYAWFGDGSWIDYSLSFEVKVKGADKVRFGAKGRTVRGRFTFTPLSIEGLKLPDDSEEWHSIVVNVEGARFDVSCGKTGGAISIGNLKGAGEPGYFVIQILGDGASMSLRKLGYKLFNKEASEDEKKADGEEGEVGADDGKAEPEPGKPEGEGGGDEKGDGGTGKDDPEPEGSGGGGEGDGGEGDAEPGGDGGEAEGGGS